jgi:hypothetical protein
MNTKEKYFELCYEKRIHEFSKIDKYKNWSEGEARKKYESLDSFYQKELNIDKVELYKFRNQFKKYNDLYRKYYNQQRQEFFSDPDKLIKWFNDQNDRCNYCEITQPELLKIVADRKGNLTLNQKTKRSKGTLEIEKLHPSLGYTYSNSVLSCPFCNNAKSNLISEDDWREFFAPAMKKYFNSILNGTR